MVIAAIATAVIGGVMGALGFYFFYLFILEESVQTAGFGVYSLIASKNYERMMPNIELYENVANTLMSAAEYPEKILLTPLHLGEMTEEQKEASAARLTMADAELIRKLVLPYKLFATAALETAKAYRTVYSQHIKEGNPLYYADNDKLDREIELDKFRVKQAQDSELDILRRQKDEEKDYLQLIKKETMQQAAADKRNKVITKEEYDVKVLNITENYNTEDRAITAKYDQLERDLKLRYFDNFYVMERIAENKRLELKVRYYPIGIPPQPPPEIMTATVTEIIDGDTIKIAGWTIRLAGIDAAELPTTQGVSDKSFLAGLILGKTITIKTDPEHPFEMYGRVLSVIFLGSMNINMEMLRKCHAQLSLIGTHKYINIYEFKAAAAECTAPIPPPTAPPPTEPPPSPTTGGVVGVITDSSTGAKLQGVAVTAGTQTVNTDINGNYSIQNLSPGDYTLRVSKSGYINAGYVITIIAGTIYQKNIQMQPSAVPPPTPTYGSVTGKITDSSTGAVLDQVTVTMGDFNIRSNSEGIYLIENASPGSYTLNVLKSGYVSAGYAVSITAGVTTTLNIQMQPSAAPPPPEPVYSNLTGTVKDGISGEIITGVAIAFNGQTQSSDSAGNFQFINLSAGSYTMKLVKSGYVDKTVAITLAAGERKYEVVSLDRTAYPPDVAFAVISSFSYDPTTRTLKFSVKNEGATGGITAAIYRGTTLLRVLASSTVSAGATWTMSFIYGSSWIEKGDIFDVGSLYQAQTNQMARQVITW